MRGARVEASSDGHWIEYLRGSDKEDRAIKDRELQIKERKLEIEKEKAEKQLQLREKELEIEKEKMEVKKLKWRAVFLGKDLTSAFDMNTMMSI